MSRTSYGWIGLACLAAGLLAACQPVEPAGSEPGAAATPKPGSLRPSTTLSVSVSSVITQGGIAQEGAVATGVDIDNPLVKQAVADLGTRLGIGSDAITLVRAEAVVWPDGSLGCPRPGMAYKQVQQDGLRIVLEAQGRQFEYHSGGSRPPFLCESPAKTGLGTPAPGNGD